MSEASRGRRAAHRADLLECQKDRGADGVKAEVAGGGGANRQP